MMSSFREYSKYYNLLYKDKDYKSEAKYIHSLIQKYRPEAKAIFEMGCGTGKHSIELMNYNYWLKGIDLSEEMLKEANKTIKDTNFEGRLSYENGDVRFFRCQEKFDVCISLFHVMSYQTTNEDINNAFMTASYHLKKGGIFIFDCWYGPAVLTDRPVIRVKRLEDSDLEIVRIAEPVSFPNENVVDVNYEIIIKNKYNNNLSTISECHRMRYLFLPEIKNFLDANGFDLIDSFEFMTGKSIGFSSWNACFVGRVK